MATLDSTDRARIWRGLMRYWSNVRQTVGIDKAALLATIGALDDWMEANQTAINAAIPQPARTALTPQQKTIILCLVAVGRVFPGVPDWLRRILGVEVD